MSAKTARPFSLFKSAIFLFLLFHVVKACSPPPLNELTINTAEVINLQEMILNLEKYVDKPVVLEEVRVVSPCYLYLGSFYYAESLDGKNRIMVLSREFPPKEGTVIKLFGGIQPVFSAKNINMAFFKEADYVSSSSV